MGKFNPDTWDSKRWYRRLIQRVEAWDADDLMDLLRSRMLKEDYPMRLSASNCLKETSKIYSATFLTQDPDGESEAPIKISTGTEEAKARSNHSNTSRLK